MDIIPKFSGPTKLIIPQNLYFTRSLPFSRKERGRLLKWFQYSGLFDIWSRYLVDRVKDKGGMKIKITTYLANLEIFDYKDMPCIFHPLEDEEDIEDWIDEGKIFTIKIILGTRKDSADYDVSLEFTFYSNDITSVFVSHDIRWDELDHELRINYQILDFIRRRVPILPPEGDFQLGSWYSTIKIFHKVLKAVDKINR